MSTKDKIVTLPFKNPEKDKINIILKNILKMLSKRKVFTDTNDINDTGHSLLSYKTKAKNIVPYELTNAYKDIVDLGDNTFTINTISGLVAVKILFQNISSTSQTSFITQFLNEYSENMKIIIVPEINSKTAQIPKHNLQIFEEEKLLSDVTEFIFQPVFIILNNAQKEDVYKKYRTKDVTMSRFESIDPIVHYYNIKKGDITKIISSSMVSGAEVSYRLLY